MISGCKQQQPVHNMLVLLLLPAIHNCRLCFSVLCGCAEHPFHKAYLHGQDAAIVYV